MGSQNSNKCLASWHEFYPNKARNRDAVLQKLTPYRRCKQLLWRQFSESNLLERTLVSTSLDKIVWIEHLTDRSRTAAIYLDGEEASVRLVTDSGQETLLCSSVSLQEATIVATELFENGFSDDEQHAYSSHGPIEIREFRPEDNAEYSSWFEDEELNRFLGPAWTGEELAEVLNSSDGCEFVGIEDGQMVGVVGVVHPDEEHPCYTIAAIAVRPSLRGRDIGKRLVQQVMARYRLEAGESWVTYVDEANPGAKRFFEKMGWQLLSEPPANNSMYCFGSDG